MMAPSTIAAITTTDIPLDSLPTTTTTRGSTAGGLIFMAIATVWGGVPTVMVANDMVKGVFSPDQCILFVFTATGLGLFLFGLNQFFLDKSVTELVREKKLTVDFDPTAAVPRELNAGVAGDSLAIPIVLALPATFFYMGFFVEDCPIIFGIVGALFGCLVVAALAWELITLRQIRLRTDEIHALRQTSWGPTAGTHTPASEIEVVKVGTCARDRQEGVVIVTDRDEQILAAGLPRDTLTWLRDCILATLSR